MGRHNKVCPYIIQKEKNYELYRFNKCFREMARNKLFAKFGSIVVVQINNVIQQMSGGANGFQ